VNEGKGHLNFDEYTHRNLRFQYHKFEEVVEQIENGEMPLDSYTWLHNDAKLSVEERSLLIDWAKSRMADMEAKYPIDSLKRKK
jgi:exonuclease VII small subunit